MKTKRNYNVNTNMLTAIEVFMNVYSGKSSRFPAGFWSEKGALKRSIEINKYFLEEILKFDREKICTLLTTDIYVQNNLRGMLKIVFGSSVFKAINATYPREYKPWELRRVYVNCWNDEKKGKQAVKWLVGEKLKWRHKQVCDNLTSEVFKEHGLAGMLSVLYNESPYLAINSAYPGKYMPWEMPQGYNGIWDDDERKIKAIKWLIETKFKWNHEEVCFNFCNNTIKKNKLDGLSTDHFSSSPYKMLEAAYPGQYKPWELRKTQQQFWNDDNNIEEAIKWLLEKCPNPSSKDFQSNGLGGLLNHKFRNCVRRAVKFTANE